MFEYRVDLQYLPCVVGYVVLHAQFLQRMASLLYFCQTTIVFFVSTNRPIVLFTSTNRLFGKSLMKKIQRGNIVKTMAKALPNSPSVVISGRVQLFSTHTMAIAKRQSFGKTDHINQIPICLLQSIRYLHPKVKEKFKFNRDIPSLKQRHLFAKLLAFLKTINS